MCSSSDSKSRRSDISARYGVLRVQRILDFGKFCQQVFKQQHFLAAQHFLDSVVTLVHFFADFLIQLLALGSQLQKNTSLVVGRFQADDQTRFFKAGQDTGQAGAQNTRLIRQILKVQRAVFRQKTDNPPLLIGNIRLIQNRPELGHQGFPCLYQTDIDRRMF